MNSSNDKSAKVISITLWFFLDKKYDKIIKATPITNAIKINKKENDPTFAFPLTQAFVIESAENYLGHSSKHYLSCRYNYLPSGVLLQARHSSGLFPSHCRQTGLQKLQISPSK